MLIYDISSPDEERSMNVLVNPRIIENEGEVLSENEGCLSVPEYRSDVKRFASILVEAYDRDEKLLRFEAQDLLSIVLQHEIDHLNGKLFIDRISTLKKQLYARRVQKQLKRGD
jgi:peptide deformylase